MTPDWDIFFRARRGDENAWRSLVDAYQERLSALALLISKAPEATKDIVQETFVKALQARISNTSGTVSGYLGTIAYRLALKEARRTRRHVPLSGNDQTDTNPNPLERLLRNEREQMVADAISKLDEDHRQVLVLRCYSDHSYEEIAQLMKIPLGTVKSRIFYAVKTCRELLHDKGVL